MAAVAFNTLKCARRLKDAGCTDRQVEVQAEIKEQVRLVYWMLAVVIASAVIPQVYALLSS